jgi:hypothetical protein
MDQFNGAISPEAAKQLAKCIVEALSDAGFQIGIADRRITPKGS